MSDPVTNVEIEDVLSSIRRLVSEDARVRPLSDRAYDRAGGNSLHRAEDIAPNREAPGKLVLTPALRVTESDVVPQDQDGSAGDLAGDDVAQDSSAAAEADQPAHAEPAPVSDDHLPYSSDHAVAAEPSAPADAGQDDRLDPVAEAAQSADAMPWEDHQDDDSADDSRHDTHTHTLLLDDAVSVEDADEATEAWPQDPGIGASEVPQAAETPLRGAARSSGGASGGFVFSSVRDGADQGATVKEDAVQQDTEQQDAAEAFLEADSGESLFADDETILDEEMLRELVTEIVRQELQGALGERITRNVRKLVRREIHRALTSHELE